MATARQGNIVANYSQNNIDEKIANDIVETIWEVSALYPRDIFENLAYPNLVFDLSKCNDEIGYQISLNGYNWVSDKYLQFTKEMYHKLNKKYRINILFFNKNGKITLNYSDDIYFKTLLKNNIISYLLLPPIVFGCLYLSNYLITWILTLTNNSIILNLAEELLVPLICYPISIVAFGTQPPIMITRIISYFIIFSSAFAFYFISGNGLYGSFILLAIFILKSIQNAIS